MPNGDRIFTNLERNAPPPTPLTHTYFIVASYFTEYIVYCSFFRQALLSRRDPGQDGAFPLLHFPLAALHLPNARRGETSAGLPVWHHPGAARVQDLCRPPLGPSELILLYVLVNYHLECVHFQIKLDKVPLQLA